MQLTMKGFIRDPQVPAFLVVVTGYVGRIHICRVAGNTIRENVRNTTKKNVKSHDFWISKKRKNVKET